MYNSFKATGRLKAITRLVWLRHVILGFLMTLVVWERKAQCGCERIATLPEDDGYERKNTGNQFLGDLMRVFLAHLNLAIVSTERVALGSSVRGVLFRKSRGIVF